MKCYKIFSAIIYILAITPMLVAQQPELETAQMKSGRLWGGVAANGDQATFDFRAGFFPNDYDIIQYRGQGSENYFGSGFRLACTNWLAPNDSLYRVAVFGPKNDFMANGKVIVPITNYIRYNYTDHSVNGQAIGLGNFGEYDPAAFSGGTYDQVVEATYKNVLGVEVKRRILQWTQSFNNNYVIIEVELTNTGVDRTAGDGSEIVVPDTLENFYLLMNQGTVNNYYSNGSYPAPGSGERPNFAYTWQHYYGGRQGDSLRVFYFYSADDPATAGDNMGNPVKNQGGRLLNTNMLFYTILHASAEPYTDPSLDVDDFLQPKVTYIGTETKIPDPGSGEDPYGSKNYWAIRGGYSDAYPMTNSIEGTHHGLNNDEQGTPDFSNFPGGTRQSVNSKNFSSFGPYTFLRGQKIKIVYAVGVAGLGIEKSAEVGSKWLNNTLTNPDNMPDPNTGWFPSNFQFPENATEQDKMKDRWISMGIDSVMTSAWRAKWNYDNNYQIPQAPPPPEYFYVRGSSQSGVIIEWKNSAGESLENFAGYRVMRKLSGQDTVFYEEIYSSGPEDKASQHEIADTTAITGAPYYYYIQTKAVIDEDDMYADPLSRGKAIYSSRVWIPNIISINPPPRVNVVDDLTKIRVVPNPYNINDPLVKKYYAGVGGRQLNFYNLPPVVSIKIFTENGDLVKTIDHNEPLDNTGHIEWNMITDNQQVINSGVYIAVFQKPNGEQDYEKFIVVR